MALGGWLLPLLAGLLTGCGFHLRGSVDLPPQMKAVLVQGLPANDPFVRDFQEVVRLSGGTVVADKKAATSVLRIVNQSFDRRPISLNQSGLVNEYELVYLLNFELFDPDGKNLLPPQAIQIVRDYFDNQQRALGTEEQQGVIRGEVYKEAARTLLQRVELALAR